MPTDFPMIMTCPDCGHSEMMEGEFEIRKRALDWCFFGLGFSDLFFRRKDEKKQRIVMNHGRIRRGYQCGNCQTAVITMETRSRSRP